MKRNSLSVYVDISRENPLPLYAAVRILGHPPHPPPAAYVLNSWPLFQSKNI